MPKTAIVVTEPTRSGLHDLERILELTKEFDVPSYIIINKSDLNINLTNEITDWCTEHNTKVIGKILFNPEVVEAMVHCKSIIEWAPESELSKELKIIWEKIKSYTK